MGPSRKRPRTTAPNVEESDSSKPADAPSVSTQSSTTVADGFSKIPTTKEDDSIRLKGPVNETKSGEDSLNFLKPRSSWYGTWPRKSTASTQVARETILADKQTNGQSSTDLSRYEQKKSSATTVKRPPSMSLGKSKETSDITMGGTLEASTEAADKQSKGKDMLLTDVEPKTGPTKDTEELLPGDEASQVQSTKETTYDGASKSQSKIETKDPVPYNAASKAQSKMETENPVPNNSVSKSKSTKEIKNPLPVDGPSKVRPAKEIEDSPVKAKSKKEKEGKDAATQQPSTSSGWFGVWRGQPITTEPQNVERGPAVVNHTPKLPSVTGKQMPELPTDAAAAPPALFEDESKTTTPPSASTSWFGLWSTAEPSTAEKPKEKKLLKLAETGRDTAMEDASTTKTDATAASGSSWAFWTTETSKKPTAPAEKPKETGQLAVKGKLSQTKPGPAKAETVKESKKGNSAKRERPLSAEIDETTKEPVKRPIQSGKASPKGATSQTLAAAKSGPPNLVIPSVKSTYRLVENPSILQQIARLILHGQQQPSKHVFLIKEAPKIKKALSIGIHGLFPAQFLRTVIGQPTGTSIRFANHGASAIRRWGDQHGCVDCAIEKVALEGEGKIGERVDNLWKLLLNWVDHIRQADFILVSCHSQGVPVAVMLVAKLIEFGVVTTGRIAICAMAGVSLGPFADYKSRLFSGSAAELFEFAEPTSTVSKRYEDALRIAVKYGVRVTYCGSIDDQLVSMESSTFSTATHPYIYRAVFVDGRIHAPNFLSHLIGLALKLRNLGVSDHGLIRELSAPLAGSLYTGEGHSRLYDEEKVYDLAVEYALETTSVGDVPLQMAKYEVHKNANPYVLPWIMRGILEEDFVKTELDTEVTELLKQFDDWNPATKVLKDVKYRLEAVRSKL